MSKKRAGLIFDRWKASLADKDRKITHTSENFDELFYSLSSSGIDFDVARALVNDAVTAHMPTKSVADHTYKKHGKYSSAKSFSEYMQEWRGKIEDKANNSFFTFFEIDGPEEKKVFGSMSAREYTLQRKHAESFPLLDLDKLAERTAELEDFEDIDEICSGSD